MASDWPQIQDVLADQPAFAEHVQLPLPLARSRPGVSGASMATSPASASSLPALRGYQRAALQTWDACGRRGVIELPTGAGKTRVALEAIQRLGLGSLVLVPTRVLLSQWVEQLRALLATTSSEPDAAAPGRLGDGHRELRCVTVATYASALAHAARIGASFELVIVDEAHHAGGLLRPEVLETCVAPFRLGLTAMAPADATARSRLESLVGPVVFQLRVRDLLGDALAPLRLVGVGVEMSPEEHASWLADMALFRSTAAGHALELRGRPAREVHAILGRSAEGREALAARARAAARAGLTSTKRIVLAEILAAHREERVLVFTRDRAAAHAIAREHLVPAVTCDMRARERRDVLDAFARGDIRTLVSPRVLDEGFDVPGASVAIVLGASGGARQHVQRVGRILRPAAGKRAVIFDVFHLEAEAAAASARRRALAL